jgi:flavodoxin
MDMDLGEFVPSGSKILLMYYSRTGTTRRIAEEIRGSLGCDVEEVVDKKSRSGLLGWLRAGRDGGVGNLTHIGPGERDVSDYDLVIPGTPIWNGNVSAPIRTYVVENRERMPEVAFFSTQDGEENKAFDEMEGLCGKAPIVVVQLVSKREIKTGENKGKLEGFLSVVSAHCSGGIQ